MSPPPSSEETANSPRREVAPAEGLKDPVHHTGKTERQPSLSPRDPRARKTRSVSRGRSRRREESERRHERSTSRARQERSQNSGSKVAARQQRPPEPNRPPLSRQAFIGSRKCPHCWKQVTQQESGYNQHTFLNQNCLSWQMYNKFRPEEQKKPDAWKKAQNAAKVVRDKRLQQSVTEAVAPASPPQQVNSASSSRRPTRPASSQGARTHVKQESPDPPDSPSPSVEKRASRKRKTKKVVRQPSTSPESSPEPEKKKGKKSQTHKQIVINIG